MTRDRRNSHQRHRSSGFGISEPSKKHYPKPFDNILRSWIVRYKKQGWEYTRSDNPNRHAFESLLASLESGHSALALASGSAAVGLLISSLPQNSHVLSVNDVYGGTARYLRHVASALQGIRTTFVDLETLSDEEILAEIREETKVIWIETPTNPTLRIIDIPRIVRLANASPARPLVLVDNTFMSPFYQSPLLLGADVVLHSITKYINGHSDVLMGALILPSPESLARKPAGVDLESRLRYLQNAIGSVPSAYDSWLAQRGAKTLALRMKTHGTNALRVARWLNKEGRQLGLVKEVVYPGLKATAGGEGRYALVKDKLLSPHAKKWIESGHWDGAAESSSEGEDEGVPFGGMVSFRVADPSPASSSSSANLLAPPTSSSPANSNSSLTAERFLTSTHLFTLAESLGGIESLAELPARMTHASLPPDARAELGISDDLVRLSVGVEDVADILVDLERALRWAVKGERWSPKVEA